MFIKRNGVIKMLSLENILSSLSKAVVIEIMSGRYGHKKIMLSFPTNDLDESYSLYSYGKGFLIKWEGMDLINEDFKIDKDDFTNLYKECINEILKRENC